MSNFDFLKNKNKDLYKIIADAENLFRDEYFEQSMVQVRKFAENLCFDLLGESASTCETFDLIINKIKDNMGGNIRLKEFVEDLYYIKKNGNAAAHAQNVEKQGETALECLERAFEISIFYMNEKYGYSKKIDSLLFSEELLMTGKTTQKPTKSLKQKYVEELKKERSNSDKKAKKEKQASPKERPKKATKTKCKSKTGMVFLVATILTLFICFVAYVAFLILTKKP